jgi:hypothetical protein
MRATYRDACNALPERRRRADLMSRVAPLASVVEIADFNRADAFTAQRREALERHEELAIVAVFVSDLLLQRRRSLLVVITPITFTLLAARTVRVSSSTIVLHRSLDVTLIRWLTPKQVRDSVSRPRHAYWHMGLKIPVFPTIFGHLTHIWPTLVGMLAR